MNNFRNGLLNLIKPKIDSPYLIVPPKETKTDFSVSIGVCVHRNIQVKNWTMLRTLEKCPNIKMDVFIKEGDALISRSRSIVASKFLDTKYDYLFFIDDDIVGDPFDLTQMLWLCHKDKLDVFGATYVTKSVKDTNVTVRPLGEHSYIFGKDGGMFECLYLSTGCMVIHRRVLEKMVEQKEVKLCHESDLKFYSFFRTQEKELDGELLYLSEDWDFCEKARRLGFKIWCDSRVKLKHIGFYEYDWDDVFRPPKAPKDNYEFTIHQKKNEKNLPESAKGSEAV